MQICDQVGGKKEPKTRLGEKAQGVCVAIQEVRFDPSSIVLALERADFFIGLASLEAPLKNVFPGYSLLLKALRILSMTFSITVSLSITTTPERHYHGGFPKITIR